MSEKKFRTLTVSSPIGMFLDDAQGNVIYINEKCAKLVGRPAGEALNLDWAPAIHPDDRKRMTTERAKAIKNGEEFHLEHRWLHPDGKVVWTLVDIEPFRASDGEVTGYIGTLMDITKRKQAEKQIRKLSQAIEQSPASVVLTDLQGNIEYVNPQFTHISGYTFSEVKSQNPRILKSGEKSRKEYQELGIRSLKAMSGVENSTIKRKTASCTGKRRRSGLLKMSRQNCSFFCHKRRYYKTQKNGRRIGETPRTPGRTSKRKNERAGR